MDRISREAGCEVNVQPFHLKMQAVVMERRKRRKLRRMAA